MPPRKACQAPRLFFLLLRKTQAQGVDIPAECDLRELRLKKSGPWRTCHMMLSAWSGMRVRRQLYCGCGCIQCIVRGVLSVLGCSWALVYMSRNVVGLIQAGKHHLSIEYGPLGEPPALTSPCFSPFHFSNVYLVQDLHTRCSFFKVPTIMKSRCYYVCHKPQFCLARFQVLLPLSNPTPPPHHTTTVNSRTKSNHR